MSKEYPGATDLEARSLLKPLHRQLSDSYEVVYTLTPEGQELAKEIVATDFVIKIQRNHKNNA